MPQNKDNRVKRTLKQKYIYIAYEEHPFDIDDYVQNPAMIRKLHEEMKTARAASGDLRTQLEETISSNQDLELQRQELYLKLNEAYKDIERLTD